MRWTIAVALCTALAGVAACDDDDDDGVVAPPRELREVYHQYPAWSPNGEMIAFWGQSRLGETPTGVWLFHVPDSTMTFLAAGDTPRWSPDGRHLAISRNAQIAILDVATGETRPVTVLGRNWFPSYSPDGRWIVYDRTAPVDSSGLWIAAADGSSAPRRISPDLHGARFPAWSPDGEFIACSIWEGNEVGRRIWVVRPDGSDPQRLSDGGPIDMFPAWSPDGTKIAYTAREGIRIFDLATRQDRRLPGTERDRLADYQGVAFAPDGQQLVYNKEYLWVIGADGSRNHELTGPGPPEVAPEFQ